MSYAARCCAFFEFLPAFGTSNGYCFPFFGLADPHDCLTMQAFVVFVCLSFTPDIFAKNESPSDLIFDGQVFLPFHLPLVYVF